MSTTKSCDLLLAVIENLATACLGGLLDEPRPVLAVRAANGRVILGPLQVRGRSVCLDCYRYWTATSEAAREEADSAARSEDIRLAAQLSAELVKSYPYPRPFSELLEGVISVETNKPGFATHAIFRRADCVFCGRATRVDPREMRAHCSPLTGIVRHMDITAAPIGGVHVALASFVSPLAVAGTRPRLRERLCTGRGLSVQQAEESCIGEALERYSLVYRGDEPVVRGRIEQVGGVHPNEIMRLSERQFETREEWNRLADERFRVPEPFDTGLEIEWLEARDLISDEVVPVPAACCLMWYRPSYDEAAFGLADTIGCASWKTWEGALGRALLELVERDSLAIWWYNRLRRPMAPIESFEDTALSEIQKGLARLGRNLMLLDVTTDTGIPAYVAIAALEDGSEPLFSSACDFSPRGAARRAASEILQFWFAAAHHKSIDPEIQKWLTHATLENQPYLCPLGTVEAEEETGELSDGESLSRCVSKLRILGMRPLGLDLSRPDVVLKTARAIVPGLRHIWNRKSAGRLFDVPVQLGWRGEPVGEEDLNSICCMI